MPSKDDLLPRVIKLWSRWFMIKMTLDAAIDKGEPAGTLTFLTSREAACWADLKQAWTDWYNAA